MRVTLPVGHDVWRQHGPVNRGAKRKARQLVLTSLFEFEPGCDSGVTGFGGLPEVHSQTPFLRVFLKQRFSNWTREWT